jgi:hypothetical protein
LVKDTVDIGTGGISMAESRNHKIARKAARKAASSMP